MGMRNRVLAVALIAGVVVLAGGCRREGATESRGASPGAESATPAHPDPAQLFALFASMSAPPEIAGDASLRVQGLGTLLIGAGGVSVSDAMVHGAPLRIEQAPQGPANVQLLVASVKEDERVAAARLLFSARPPTAWKEIGSVAVDSGTAAFYDPALSSAVAASPEAFSKALLEALKVNLRDTYTHAEIDWQGAALIAFSSGTGDGAYPVFVGTDDAGAPVGALIDFRLLPWR